MRHISRNAVRQLIFLLFPFLIISNGVAQSGSKTLPEKILLDPAVRYGKLKNGLTYYIRREENARAKISFNLVVKAGKYQEDSDQTEISHLIEHMAFKGTKNYPPSDSYFKKYGLQWGDEVSAQTAGDYTYYYINVPDKANSNLVYDALHVLRDYAGEISFDSAKIELERKVVQEEIRMRSPKEPGDGIYMKEVNSHPFYKHSLKDAVDNLKTFEQASLFRFYRDWYRPDMEALVIVGEVDVKEMERQVKLLFSDFKRSDKPRKRDAFIVHTDLKNHFIIVRDKAYDNVVLTINSKRESFYRLYKGDYRRLEVMNLYNQLFQSRMAVINHTKPILTGSHRAFHSGAIFPGLDGMNTRVYVKSPEILRDAFVKMASEIERIIRFGFSQNEVDNAKRQLLADYVAERNGVTSEYLVEKYLRNYVYGEAAPSPDFEFELKSSLLKEIGIEELTDYAKEWFGRYNRDILIEAPEGTKLPDEVTIEEWVTEVRKLELDSFRSQTKTSSLQSIMSPAEIDKLKIGQCTITKIDQLGLTELLLDNGIKVVLKPILPNGVGRLGGEMQLHGVAAGGTSQFPDENFWTANFAPTIVQYCGISGINKADFFSFMSDNDLKLSISMGSESRDFWGTFNENRAEYFLQALYKYITAPSKDSVGFKTWLLAKKKSMIDSRKTTPERQLSDTMKAIMNDYSFRVFPPSISDLENIDLNKAYNIYNHSFSDMKGFTFVITGNFELTQIVPLVIKYIGNLPYTPAKSHKLIQVGRVISKVDPQQKIRKLVFGGTKEEGKVYLSYRNSQAPYNLKEHVELIFTEAVLYTVLLERLRNREAGVYTVSVINYYLSKNGIGVNISFSCSPENTWRLINAVTEEISHIKEHGLSEDLFQQCKKSVQENKLNINSRYFKASWQRYLSEQYLYGRDPKEILNSISFLEKITVNDIQKFITKYLDEDYLMEFILLPEKYRGAEFVEELK